MFPVLPINLDLKVGVEQISEDEEFMSGKKLDNIIIGTANAGNGTDGLIQDVEAGDKSDFFQRAVF